MITPEQLAEITDRVEAEGISQDMVQQLRRQYPGMHFTYCMDEEINNARPVLERPDFNIYLVDTRQHCLNLTTDPDIATGLVLAEIEDES